MNWSWSYAATVCERDYGAVEAIIDFLTNYAKVEYLIDCSDWPDEEGGVCAVSFVDRGHPQLVLFDYKY